MTRDDLSTGLAVALLLLSACAHGAPALHTADEAGAAAGSAEPPPVVRLVTSDIPNFWRAFDLAAAADSAERVRIFREVYLLPGSPGLQDWARSRLANQRVVMEALVGEGWTREDIGRRMQLPRADTARAALEAAAVPHILDSAALEIARATARWPRYYAGVRERTLAIDTSTEMRGAIQRGLRGLLDAYPEGELSDVYFVIGRLTSGGTVGASGRLIGAELSTRGPDTPLDELPQSVGLMTSSKTPGQMAHLVVHEAVHTLQRGVGRTLLELSLREGGADFLAELATGIPTDFMIYHQYGRAHEREVWEAFAREMDSGETVGSWLGSWGNPDNRGAPDLGYWVGYRIAEAYHARAADKRQAVRDLILVRDAPGILRTSGYGEGFE
jgi:hypothetical protein